MHAVIICPQGVPVIALLRHKRTALYDDLRYQVSAAFSIENALLPGEVSANLENFFSKLIQSFTSSAVFFVSKIILR